jgi:hypothetical protein
MEHYLEVTMYRPTLTAALVAMCMSSQLTGCSAAGYSGGQAYDANEPDEYIFLPSQIDSIQQNAYVEVLRLDSTTVKGYYARKKGTLMAFNSDTLILSTSRDTLLIPVNDVLTIHQPVTISTAASAFTFGLMVTALVLLSISAGF